MEEIRSVIVQAWENAPWVPVLDLYIHLFVLIGIGLAAVCALVFYILKSRALQQLAYDRWLGGSFWAWFPVGDGYVLGSIADDYAQKVWGKRHHQRHWLLWLSVCAALVAAGWVVCAVLRQLQVADTTMVLQILLLVLGALWLVRWILGTIALLAVYTSCDPDRATANIIVSIWLPVTAPFILFACRKRHFGMPPAKMSIEIPNTWKAPQ